MILFEKYELNEQGQIKNINTGNFLKVEETANGRFVKVVDEGKTKRINLNDYTNPGQPETINEENNEEVINQTTEITQEITEVTNEVSNNEQTNEEEHIDETIQNEQTETVEHKPKKSRKYDIVVTEMDDTQRKFGTFKEANDYYGLRKDYLNYCITEKFQKMLDKVNLKKVEKVEKVEE